MTIEVKNVSKSFGTYHALNNVNLTVADGELMALLGPSGSGKTTLLRIIAGLDQTDSGQVLVHGQDLTKQALLALQEHVGVRERGLRAARPAAP
jgi:sulfate transport system ATP-binding protein